MLLCGVFERNPHKTCRSLLQKLTALKKKKKNRCKKKTFLAILCNIFQTPGPKHQRAAIWSNWRGVGKQGLFANDCTFVVFFCFVFIFYTASQHLVCLPLSDSWCRAKRNSSRISCSIGTDYWPDMKNKQKQEKLCFGWPSNIWRHQDQSSMISHLLAIFSLLFLNTKG